MPDMSTDYYEILGVARDATDEEFWARLNRDQKVELVLLSMDRRATLSVVKRLSAKAFKGAIAAMARFSGTGC